MTYYTQEHVDQMQQRIDILLQVIDRLTYLAHPRYVVDLQKDADGVYAVPGADASGASPATT